MLPSVVGGAGEQPPVPFSVANADKGVSSGKEAQPELQAPSAGRRAGATGNDSGDRRTGAVAPVDAQAAATEAAVAASGGDPGERAASGGTVAVSTHFQQKVSTDPSANVTDLKKYKSLREKGVTSEVSTHFSVKDSEVSTHFDRKKWKRSRVKSGYLIRRIKGYDISEDEYGVSYLYVISRQPSKKTSADFSLYEHAGFSTWHSLEVSGRLVLEGRNDRKRLNSNRNRAS